MIAQGDIARQVWFAIFNEILKISTVIAPQLLIELQKAKEAVGILTKEDRKLLRLEAQRREG